MIKNFEIFEAKIKWYSKGEFNEESGEDLQPEIDLKVGDTITMENLERWDPDRDIFIDYGGDDKDSDFRIMSIKKTKNAANLEYGSKKLAEYDGLVFKVRSKWPWYRFKR